MSRTPGRMKCTKGNEPWFFYFLKRGNKTAFFSILSIITYPFFSLTFSLQTFKV
ncbi:hypothetical protein MUS_0539 [Bacillus velezensis YAU B9601-Y2]|uniref:Uncharacterized protein n=1 Tax=Bacillus amyloliquefaciens (strain Y2) TaxID=1155777 RepID=I2C1T8_BACAY|nr:hypothetical protein MUS_0539 [Bacillus velezensis YAU B9601-Y2]